MPPVPHRPLPDRGSCAAFAAAQFAARARRHCQFGAPRPARHCYRGWQADIYSHPQSPDRPNQGVPGLLLPLPQCVISGCQPRSPPPYRQAIRFQRYAGAPCPPVAGSVARSDGCHQTDQSPVPYWLHFAGGFGCCERSGRRNRLAAPRPRQASLYAAIAYDQPPLRQLQYRCAAHY